MKYYILYHSPCIDGFAASCILKYLFRHQNPICIPVTYGKPPPPMEDGSHVYIVDFCYPRSELDTLKNRMAHVMVIDHHISAKEQLEGFRNFYFDPNHSGAVLAWQWSYGPIPIPKLLQYIEDRDLWRHVLADTDAVHYALRAMPQTFEAWESLPGIKPWTAQKESEQQITDLIERGKTVLSFIREQVEYACASWQIAHLRPASGRVIILPRDCYLKPCDDTDTIAVMAVNAGMLQSEITHQLLQQYPLAGLAACYHYREDGKVQWRLTSRNTSKPNALEVAKMMLGGGHPNAAGFIISASLVATPGKT